MAEAKKQPCAEIVWRIENFTYCWQEKKESLTSCKFFVECLDKTSWHLSLYPKGDAETEDLGLYLRRAKHDEGNDTVLVKFELAVLEDGNLPYVTKVSGGRSFSRNVLECVWGFNIVSRSDIIKDAEKLYPKNVLTVRCKMWHVNAEQPCSPTVIHLGTLIPVTQCLFKWNIDLAAVETSDQEKTVNFPSLFGTGDFLKFTISYVTRNRDRRLIKIFVSGETKKEYSFECDIRTVQTKEELFLKISKISTLPYEKFYEPLLKQNQLVKISEKYSMEGTLLLNCELDIIFHEMKTTVVQSVKEVGETSEKNIMEGASRLDNEPHIISVFYNSEQPSMWLPRVNGNYNYVKSTEIIPAFCSCALKSDVLKMYRGASKSDFNLKVKSQTFPVHANILSARSAVLNRMFDSEMKEKQEKVLKIEDLDENTVRKMLDYVYTDSPGQLDIESALKLYYAGDKYELFGLKKLCSEYMKQNIATCNLYDILMVAHRHNDENLKSSAIQFIAENEKEVVTSDQFKTFTKNNLDFGMEIVQGLFEYKFKG